MNLVILSSNSELYSTKRLIESGTARGHQVLIVDPANCYLELEAGKFAINHLGQILSNIDAVIPRISTGMTFYGSAIIRQLELQGIKTSCSSQALEQCRDKLTTLQILAAAKVDIPKTAFAFQPVDVDALSEQVGGPPFVIKLIEGTQGIGVVLAETKAAARSALEALHSLKAKVLVQEFIPEVASADIRAFVVGGNVVASMKRQGADGDFRSNLHRGGSATAISLTDREKLAAIKAAKVLGLSVAGVDMLQSKHGPLVIEVNASPGLEGIEGATKVDVASRIIEFVEKDL